MRFCNPGTKLIVSKVFITCYRFNKSAGANCKNHDKLINYTVRVSKSVLFFHHYSGSIKKAESSLFFLSLGSIMVQKRVDYDLSDQQDLSIDKKL